MALSQLSCKILSGSLDLPVRINFRMVVQIFVKFCMEEFFRNLSSHSNVCSNRTTAAGNARISARRKFVGTKIVK